MASSKNSQCSYVTSRAIRWQGGFEPYNFVKWSRRNVIPSASHLLNMRISNLLECFKSVDAFGLWKMAQISVTAAVCVARGPIFKPKKFRIKNPDEVHSHLQTTRISNLSEFIKSVHAFGLWKMAKISVTYIQTDRQTNIHTRPSTAQARWHWAMGPCQDDRSRVSYLFTPQYFWSTTYCLGAIVQNAQNREKSKFIYWSPLDWPKLERLSIWNW